MKSEPSLLEKMKFEIATRTHIQLFQVAYITLCYDAEAIEPIRYNYDYFDPETLVLHDSSKFSPEEFPVYARKFFGDGVSDDEWQRALDHHYANNWHHWQGWIDEEDGIPRPMTNLHIVTMVADWMASSRQYTGSWNMVKWLTENLGGFEPKIKLHRDTRAIVDEILRRIGYFTDLHNSAVYGWAGTRPDFYALIETRAKQVLHEEDL